ncbi:ComEC/Rec2 family competence protein [Photobacterium damselae]|uniref:ComEC/Rec2 family competence protein n=1 Tax=Photobacterium damselae TaxID=38293 RepID=UPI003D7D28B8
MKVKFLEAKNGDSILINFTDNKEINRNILIDGGTSSTYQFKNKKGKLEDGSLKKELAEIDCIDLLILTHVDDDHIGGILNWFSKDPEAKNKVNKVWFNSGRLIFEQFNVDEIEENLQPLDVSSNLNTSIKQGATFEKYITENSLWDRVLIDTSKEIEAFGLNFTFLSPDECKLKALLHKWEKEDPNLNTSVSDDYSKSLKEHIDSDLFEEDKSIHNGSSIAFILSQNEKNLVFLGDAHPRLVEKRLQNLGYSDEIPLEAEFLKLSHHGSKSNTSYELLKLIKTNRYVVSSNGDIHKLPHKQCLARVINHNKSAEIYFNYAKKPTEIFRDEDHKEFPDFKAIYIDSEFDI